MRTELRKLVALVTTIWLFAMAPTVAEEWTYTVRPGDNLWKLSDRYLIDVSYWEKLKTLNRVSDPWHMTPGTTLRIPLPWLRKQPLLVKIRNVEGKAEITGGYDDRTRRLTVGDYVFPGDTVRTPGSATVLLEFADGSTLMLTPESELRFNEVNIDQKTGITETELELKRGRIETKVKPKRTAPPQFEIKTPAGTTSVRGTDYRLSAEAELEQSHTEVIEGRVDVANAGVKRLIKRGFGTVTTRDRPPRRPVALLPAPDVGHFPALVESLPIHFEPAEQTGVLGYRLQLAHDPEFERLTFDRRYHTRHLRIDDLPDGDFFLRVRGFDKHALEGFNATHRFTLNAKPEAPFPLKPKPHEATPEKMPLFRWSDRAAITTYQFQLARDEDFAAALVDRTIASGSEFTPDVELAPGQYFWRIASVDPSEGRGPFSDRQPFRRVTEPREAEMGTLDDSVMNIRWRAGLRGSTYGVQVARDSGFTDLLIDRDTHDPEIEIPRPDPGEYFVRIRIIEADGYVGNFGPPQTFDIPRQRSYWWLLALPLFALFAL